MPADVNLRLTAQARHMLHYTVAGDPEGVAAGIADFARTADADEVVTNPAPGMDHRLRTLEILAELWGRP